MRSIPSLPRFLRAPKQSFFLLGPRGTGKSTWLKQQFPDAIWIDLLEPDNQRYFGAKPERLRETLKTQPQKKQVVIDEIQKIPELLSLIHAIIEERQDYQFILTGSSARKLKRAGVDLLAGRAFMLPVFAKRAKREVVKHPKFYLFDIDSRDLYRTIAN